MINYSAAGDGKPPRYRVGRTSPRAGRPGLVINFVTERDEGFVSKLGGFMRSWPSAPIHKKRPREVSAPAEVRLKEALSAAQSPESGKREQDADAFAGAQAFVKEKRADRDHRKCVTTTLE